MNSAPKLFVSYSWSTPDHEQWVIDLATELRESGVDVILDKWDLKEGHDAIAFMEQMVTNASISKVAIICDRTYAEKADGRSGGVGTETQIISREVYERQEQDKFVAVVAERSEEGKPFLPTYYRSRIYVDLSESDRYAEGFEKLVRWVFDKPLHVKPEVGKPPSFVVDAAAPSLGTSALAKRCIDGLRNDKAYARGAVDEYLVAFSEGLERLRVAGDQHGLDDRIVKAIDDALSARNELLQVCTVLIQYSDAGTYIKQLHRFLESLIPYTSRPPGLNQWIESQFDNFRFLVHEIFLYVIALLVRAEQFEAVREILQQPFYVPESADGGRNGAFGFSVFRQALRSLETYNQQNKLNRISLHADLLEKRAKSSGVPFRQLMQADFICFLNGEFSSVESRQRWYPVTLLYAMRQYGPFEVFARASSKAYLAHVLPMIGAQSLTVVKNKLSEYSNDARSLPRWDYESLNPGGLMGIDELGTKA